MSETLSSGVRCPDPTTTAQLQYIEIDILSGMYGSFVAEARRARGLSQVELAAVSGIEQANISAIENGRRVPSTGTFHRLLHACGFELTATAGPHQIACPPPAGDALFDRLLERTDLEEPPVVTRSTTMATRVKVLTAVLDAAEAAVRSH